MKRTNSYVKVNDDGEVISDSVFADNRKAAASLLHCSVEHVKFVKQVRRTELQRSGDHCAKLSISLW